MKKRYNLVDLDCANCAAKMEEAIKKIDGVNTATVSFLTQKMTVDADDARFEEIMDEVVAVCKRSSPTARSRDNIRLPALRRVPKEGLRPFL